MSSQKPTRSRNSSANQAKSKMAELMHKRVSKTVQMKEQTNKGAKRN